MTQAAADTARIDGRSSSKLTPAAWRRLQIVGLAVTAYLGLSAATFVFVLVRTDGAFSYTLDDPYIHLSMAEQILRGGYGVNVGEAASASSSPLYPYLLAGLLALGFGQFAALAINLASGLAATVLMAVLAEQGGLIDAQSSRVAAAVGAVVAVLCLNFVGLSFTGMEHMLQTALALAGLVLVARFEREGRGAWALAAVIALAPLIRFEGLSMLGAGAAILAWRGRWLPALSALGVAGGGLALFVLHLHALGLPWLPSSVLVKSHDLSSGDFLIHLRSTFQIRESLVLAVMVLVPLAALAGRRWGPPALTVLFATAVMAAHLLAGPFGWTHRYEAYALAVATGLALLLWGRALRTWLTQDGGRRGVWLRRGAAAAVALAVFEPFVMETVDVGVGAHSIHLQQQQMRRFAVDVLKEPVAVNDLGWVSWKNDLYVLDLWGLGSETARKARLADPTSAWMGRLVDQHGVKIAMIYDDWFDSTPETWIKLGELRSRVRMTVIPKVAFYATDIDEAPMRREQIAAWAKGLPSDAYFAFGENPPPDKLQQKLQTFMVGVPPP